MTWFEQMSLNVRTWLRQWRWKRPTVVRPVSDVDLRCMVNLGGAALSYPESQWAVTPLVTDFAVTIAGDSNYLGAYADVLNTLQRRQVNVSVGTYISGGQVQAVIDSYPAEAIKQSQVPASWLLPSSTYVDLANGTAAVGFAALIQMETRNREGRIVFLDNIVHPSANPTWFPWTTTCNHLSRMRNDRRGTGKLLIANVAVASYVMSDADVALLGSSVDGMSFEMPFHSNARGVQADTTRQISVYRTWLAQKKIVVLIPVDLSVSPAAWTAEEGKLMAGFALLVRNPRDSLFVSQPFYPAAPDWSFWPRILGAPLGDYSFTSPSVLTRQFKGGILTVDTLTRAVTIT